MNYPNAIAVLKAADPILGQLIDQVGDCTLGMEPRSGDLLYTLCESILHQQLSTKVAKIIHQRFIGLYPAGLTPQLLLGTSEEDLRSVGLSRPKIRYLQDLAAHVAQGLPTLEELDKLDDETIISTLTPIKGIGRWTVEMLLIFRLGRLDVWPVDDLGIRTGAQRLYGWKEMPDRKTLFKQGEPWQPYRTIAAWYLWRSLERPKAPGSAF
jgi:DNA-3-methyladenine glycosylase II